jgi:choline-sulfatase
VTRRELIATGLGGLAAVSRGIGASQSGSARKKNLLILMADQHKPDCLGIAGHPVVKTPNLDALARSGTRFSSAYCANPVCTPSRASILTGLYTHHHHAYNNATPWPFQHKTIANYFSSAGYMSALIGKMHFVDAQTHGFDYRLDFNDWYQYLGPKTKLYADELSRANSGSGLPQIDDLWRDAGDPWKGVRDLDDREGPVAVGGVSKMPEADHFESFVARESIRYLKNHSKDQPFFLISSFLKPHDPFMPAKRFADMFRAEDMRLPDTWGKVNLDEVPIAVRRSIEHNAPTPELANNADEARRRIAYYYANLAQMDDRAGAVLRALRELDLEKDTVVVYTSDHGEMLGEHGLWQKFQFYESSCGIPLIIRAPGITPENKRCAAPVSLVSLLPTLAELCDVPVPSTLDGKSLMPQVRQPELATKAPIFSEYDLRNPRAKYMIRDGDLKYTFWTHDMPELYDLRSDPKEMRNLALQPEYRSRVDELKTKLFAWYTPPEINLRAPA